MGIEGDDPVADEIDAVAQTRRQADQDLGVGDANILGTEKRAAVAVQDLHRDGADGLIEDEPYLARCSGKDRAVLRRSGDQHGVGEGVPRPAEEQGEERDQQDAADGHRPSRSRAVRW